MSLDAILFTETTLVTTGSTQGSSGVTLFLPLFSGFVGGLIVLGIQTYLTNKREENERELELKGLIRIIDPEMAKNEDLLQKALEVDVSTASGPAVRPLINLRNMGVADWDRSKVRLARFADGGHFDNLDDYYRKVQELLAYMEGITSFTTGTVTEVQRLAQACKAISDVARQESRSVLDKT
jgi:hypothetical protein